MKKNFFKIIGLITIIAFVSLACGGSGGEDPPGGGPVNDIDAELFGIWQDNIGGTSLTITFSKTGIIWNGTLWNDLNTTTNAYQGPGYTFVWIANDGNISYKYSDPDGNINTVPVYTYTINNSGKLELSKSGEPTLTMDKYATIAEGNTLAQKMDWIENNAKSNTTYIVEVLTDEYLDYMVLSYFGKENIVIHLRSSDEYNKTINLSYNVVNGGSYFEVWSGVTLILGSNIALSGLDYSRHDSSLGSPSVTVSEGSLIMEEGATLIGCGVSLWYGTFEMNGGTISDSQGNGVVNGVVVGSGAAFEMNGGTIISNNFGIANVYVNYGTFEMNGGTISGGGVIVAPGTFEMNGGTISGGGVYVADGTFEMNGGSISDNQGRGVGVADGTFEMNGGTISDNQGGGVDVYFGTFEMNGGTISGNTANGGNGGGVNVYFGTFEMNGGTIYGSDSIYQNQNTAYNGAAVYLNDGVIAMYGDGSSIVTSDNTIRVINGSAVILNAPPAPTGVTATALSSSSISVSWNTVSGATSYEVYYDYVDYVGSSYGYKIWADTVAGTSYTHNELTANATYYYYIAAVNSDGVVSNYSLSASAICPPNTPTGVTATALSLSSISVSWNTVSGAAGYYIYRSSSSSGTYNKIGTSSSSPYTDTGLSASTRYYYRVAAYNIDNETSSQSTYAYATTQSPPLPPLPNGMVRINGGTFMMGSPISEPDRNSDETQQSVTVSSFYMSKYPVTQKQYETVMGNNPSLFQGSSLPAGLVNGDNLPVETVTWYDAVEFCNKLSEKEGLNPVYTITDITRYGTYISSATVTADETKNGYRLPTEAEWEYACRAGTTTPFNTGNNITTDQANYNGNSPYNGNPAGIRRGKPTEVDSFAPNAWGLYDMHGNVYEWCWDLYDSGYYASPNVVRGGSWNSQGHYLRSAARSYITGARDYTVGFRLVRR